MNAYKMFSMIPGKELALLMLAHLRIVTVIFHAWSWTMTVRLNLKQLETSYCMKSIPHKSKNHITTHPSFLTPILTAPSLQHLQAFTTVSAQHLDSSHNWIYTVVYKDSHNTYTHPYKNSSQFN